ncbi:MAG: MarR family winged helix-turn-helix transcriptional regulator [Fimbriimonadaceae bacterium]
MALTIAEHRAWAAFFVANGLMAKRIDKALATAGVVSLEVYDVLLRLEMVEGQRMRMCELAEAVLLSRSGLTRLADRLERDGLIERRACPRDRRSTHVALTRKGLAERERAWPVYRDVIATAFAGNLEPGDAEAVAAVLLRLCERLGHPLDLGGSRND